MKKKTIKDFDFVRCDICKQDVDERDMNQVTWASHTISNICTDCVGGNVDDLIDSDKDGMF